MEAHIKESKNSLKTVSPSIEAQCFHDANPDHIATPVLAADIVTGLEKRVKVLETVVKLERKLRRAKEQEVAELINKSQPANAILPNTNVSTAIAQTADVDDDATVLHLRQPDAVEMQEHSVQPSISLLSTSLTPSSFPDFFNLPAHGMQSVEDIIPAIATQAEGKTDLLALPINFRLLEYRIDKVLGRGGFGITYLATDTHLNVKVAIKEYLPGEFAYRASDKSVTPRWPEDREFYQHGLENFLVEARTLATFRHPNIVRVARFFEAHRTAYMVLEYERGKPLKEWWPKHQDMPEMDLLMLVQPLLEGLAVVHDSGYLHRDIKPDNIYVRHGDRSLVLLDFGAAQQTIGSRHKMANVVTPGYAPCEQYDAADQGASADIYAFGATLYWMISGAKPPPAPERKLNDVMVPALKIGSGRYSEGFLQAIDWALKLEANERPQDIATFMRALYSAHAGSLGWQDALRSGDAETVVIESLRTLLESPQLLQKWLARIWRITMRPASWPIAVKMTLAMVLAALMPMVIVAYYNLDASRNMVSDGELRDVEQHAQSSAGRISQLINDSRNLANYLGTDDDFVNFLEHPTTEAKAAIHSKLVGLAKSNPDVYPLFVMDDEGNALESSDAGVAGRNFKFRDYFKEAMAGHPYMTGMVVGSTAGAAGVYYSNPVFDASGKVIGAVVLRIRGSSIAGILSDIRRPNLIPFLIDSDGVLIYYPSEQQLYRSLVPLSTEKLKQIADDQRFQRNKIDSLNMPDLAGAMIGAKNVGHISYLSSITGNPEIAGFAPVKGHNWVVGMSEPRLSFERPLNQLFMNVLYSVVLVGLMFLVLALLFARSIVNPIERLTFAAHALKSGDYEKANIKVTSSDELGRLARTFNVMIDVLRQRDREQRRSKINQSEEPPAGDTGRFWRP
jgi:serine/threonine protein kinase/HAMP domain-containing protein